MKALGLVVLEKIFLCFYHDATGAGPVWTPEAQLAGYLKRIFIHSYTQNRKALGRMVLEKKIFFYVFPIVSLWELMTPGVWPFLTPRGRIYKENHYTLLHTTVTVTKYEISGPCSFREDLLARLQEVHRAIVVTSVVPFYVYVYVRVTLSVKVFYKFISLDHVDGSS